jgi:hypothetical protein
LPNIISSNHFDWVTYIYLSNVDKFVIFVRSVIWHILFISFFDMANWIPFCRLITRKRERAKTWTTSANQMSVWANYWFCVWHTRNPKKNELSALTRKKWIIIARSEWRREMKTRFYFGGIGMQLKSICMLCFPFFFAVVPFYHCPSRHLLSFRLIVVSIFFLWPFE